MTRARRRARASTVAAFALAAAALGAAGAWSILRSSAAATGGIIVVSTPGGATVEIDGKARREVTPATFRGFTTGKHRVRVAKVGRDAVEQFVTLGKDDSALVEVTLPAASHSITVNSMPQGASVYLDGHRAAGVTPMHVSTSDDDFHELRLEKLGYAPTIRRITPDDRASEINVTLASEDRPRGYLQVEASRVLPVFIDGGDTSLLSPTVPIMVTVGEHLVELREDGNVRAAARVVVRQGETVHIAVDRER